MGMVIVGAWVSSLGLLVEISCTSSRFIAKMGRPYLLNLPFLKKKNRFGAPYVAVIINCAIVYILTLIADFRWLVQIDNMSLSFNLFLQYLAILRLRIRWEDFEGIIRADRYKMPFGTKVYMCIMFMLGCGCILCLSYDILSIGIILTCVL